MAIAIKSVPVLTGVAAKKFNQKASQTSKKKHRIDFSEQVDIMKKILSKAKI